MKIVSVTANLLNTPIPEELRVESGAGLKLMRQMCLVRIETEPTLSRLAGRPRDARELLTPPPAVLPRRCF